MRGGMGGTVLGGRRAGEVSAHAHSHMHMHVLAEAVAAGNSEP